MKAALGIAVLTMIAVAAPMSAESLPVSFGRSGFTWTATGGPASPNHIWTAGDSWAQTAANSVLADATELDLNLTYDDNTLAQALDVNVELDSTVAGSFVINPGDSSFMDSFLFPSIALGGTTDIDLVATNTIGFDEGSVSLLANGATSTATLVSETPEPASFALFGIGCGLLLLVRRRFVNQ